MVVILGGVETNQQPVTDLIERKKKVPRSLADEANVGPGAVLEGDGVHLTGDAHDRVVAAVNMHGVVAAGSGAKGPSVLWKKYLQSSN